MLNTKLVMSYDCISDLEDNLHVASANPPSKYLNLSSSAHITWLLSTLDYLWRNLMSPLSLHSLWKMRQRRLHKEATAQADIEKDLDDLSTALFDQANTMVVEARFAQVQSKRKVENAELTFFLKI